MWANTQREAMQEALQNPSFTTEPRGEVMMLSKEIGFMFLWYALLWSVIEAFTERNIDIRGPLKADVDQVSNVLRRCRNAVLHVPRNTSSRLDERIQELVANTETAATVRRISRGFGQMLVEELKRRTKENVSKRSRQDH